MTCHDSSSRTFTNASLNVRSLLKELPIAIMTRRSQPIGRFASNCRVACVALGVHDARREHRLQWRTGEKNRQPAVLKAALAAASEAGNDATKQIHQRHFEEGIREVLAARKVMQQTIRQPQADASNPDDAVQALIRRLATHGESAIGPWLPPVLSLAALLVALAALVVSLLR
jgi:hypothetical protein